MGDTLTRAFRSHCWPRSRSPCSLRTSIPRESPPGSQAARPRCHRAREGTTRSTPGTRELGGASPGSMAGRAGRTRGPPRLRTRGRAAWRERGPRGHGCQALGGAPGRGRRDCTAPAPSLESQAHGDEDIEAHVTEMNRSLPGGGASGSRVWSRCALRLGHRQWPRSKCADTVSWGRAGTPTPAGRRALHVCAHGVGA